MGISATVIAAAMFTGFVIGVILTALVLLLILSELPGADDENA